MHAIIKKNFKNAIEFFGKMCYNQRMNFSNSIILEIAVDRQNEKGVFVAKEMLSTLHDVISPREKKWFFWKQKSPVFRFFLVHFSGRIRFFFEVPAEHKEFLESQLYAHYSNIEITVSQLPFDQKNEFFTQKATLSSLSADMLKLYVNLNDRTEKESIDPLSPMTSILSHAQKSEAAFFRFDFSPVEDEKFRSPNAQKIIASKKSDRTKVLLLNYGIWIKIFLSPFLLISWLFRIIFAKNTDETIPTKNTDADEQKFQKFETFGYKLSVTIASEKAERMREMAGALTIFSSPNGAKFSLSKIQKKTYEQEKIHDIAPHSLVSVTELAGLVHMPTMYVKTPGVNWVVTRRFEPPHNLPHAKNPNTPIGISNFRGSKEEFGIQPVDRARHTYIIGKTGMGKSTLLENMIYSDILAGRGVGLIDPHGDLAETILRSIPKSRTNDIVLFDPADTEFPIAFNMLESPTPALRPIVGSGLVSIFKKMFADSWGPRLEYILRNTILTLLQVPDSTLVSIPLILTHESYRKKIISKLDDPLLVQFWTQEFDKMAPNMVSEAVNPILNKVGQFLSSPILRNILGQPKNPFSMRWIMDNGKIFIVNLSK